MKIFGEMPFAEQLAHVRKMFANARVECVREGIYLADILDCFDYWAPWLFDQILEEDALHLRNEIPETIDHWNKMERT